MKLSVSLEIFTWFSFPKISALVLEGISSGKSYGLGYPGGQKWKSQWSRLVLSSINPTTPTPCMLSARLPLCCSLREEVVSQKKADLEVNLEFYLFLTSLDEDFQKNQWTGDWIFWKPCYLLKRSRYRLIHLASYRFLHLLGDEKHIRADKRLDRLLASLHLRGPPFRGQLWPICAAT